MKVGRLLGWCTGVALGVGMVVGVAPAATATPASTLPPARATYASSWHAPSGMAGSASFDPTDSTATGYANTSHFMVYLRGGTGGSGQLDLEMTAPDGQTFQLGRTYAGDDVYGVRGHGEVSNGTSCDGVAFTIVDIASTGTTITRLDMTYRSACPSNQSGYVFGQLLLGEPPAVPNVSVSADRLQWPVDPVGLTSDAVAPVRIVNTGTASLPLGEAQLSGAAAADYTVTSSTCGASLAPHAGCTLGVSFTPHGTGDRPAAMSGRLGAATVTVALDGLAPPGYTLFRASSQPGDVVGRGKQYLITDAQSPFFVTAHGGGSDFTLLTQDGPYQWLARIESPGGTPFTLGTHAADQSDPSKYYMTISGDAYGCPSALGSVTVRQVGFAADGSIDALDLTFVQRCDRGGPALTGEIAYRASTPLPTPPAAPFVLLPGATLTAGHALAATWAKTPAYRLTLTAAGDLVLRDLDRGTTLWDAHTSGAGAVLTMQRSGRLVLTDAGGHTLWSAGGNVADSFAVLQTNGDLVVDDPAYQPVFHLGTAQRYS